MGFGIWDLGFGILGFWEFGIYKIPDMLQALLALVLLSLVQTKVHGFARLKVHGYSRLTSLRLSSDLDRIESIKAAAIGTIGGSLAYFPLAVVVGVGQGFPPQWEFDSDTLALSLALFGITYRYTIRTDSNDMLKEGAIGAFAITRTLSMIHVSDSCTSLPLYCGPPFGYFDFNMIIMGAYLFVENFIAYTGSATAIDKSIENAILRPKK